MKTSIARSLIRSITAREELAVRDLFGATLADLDDEDLGLAVSALLRKRVRQACEPRRIDAPTDSTSD